MSTVRQARYEYWPPALYPATIALCIGIYFALRSSQQSLLFATYVPVALGATVITVFELYTPHLKAWIAERREVWNDLLFMVVVQMVLPKALSFLSVLTLLKLLEGGHWQPRSLWPHQWPIGAQVVLMILAADFLRYWLHRFSHELSPLWKLHAVHHSPKKLYWVNVGRFHPIEKALQFLVDALPFIVVGVAADVLSLYFVFYAVNGFFQHCNVELRMGPLNYVISGPQLHRWHHSRKPEEANSNYGNNVIVWDLVFGTYFYPRDRLVEELGLRNDEYPQDFTAQMKTPFAGRIDSEKLPVQALGEIAINLLLRIRMSWIGASLYRPVMRAADDPARAQATVLRRIMAANEASEYGREHGFSEVVDHQSFADRVPVTDFERLRPYVDRQDGEGVPALTVERPLMYNRTSGTTGAPKFIPVLERTLNDLQTSQKIFSFVQYRARPEAFHGKILGLVSPAVEGFRASGKPYGSASGHIYERMPRLTRTKYVVPSQVFSIEAYDTKYYVIARLALEQPDITYVGSANPSTFHKLLETIHQRSEEIVTDIGAGTCAGIADLPSPAAEAVSRLMEPNSQRARQLRKIFATRQEPGFGDFWPCLKLLTTWTRGSCAISLNSIRLQFPPDITVVDVGYLASEVRGTVTVDVADNAGLPTLQENFFEFVEKDKWEEGEGDFLGLQELEVGREYYLFVTTPAGLCRYDMNDIVAVSGKFRQTPTLVFVQKGKGVTNITGEKLYESQVVEAMRKVEKRLALPVRHYQMLADETTARYLLYIELDTATNVSEEEVATHLEEELQEINIEYAGKRASDRLKPLQVITLRRGTYERYKEFLLSGGRGEGQFKAIALQYAGDFDFDLSQHAVSR